MMEIAQVQPNASMVHAVNLRAQAMQIVQERSVTRGNASLVLLTSNVEKEAFVVVVAVSSEIVFLRSTAKPKSVKRIHVFPVQTTVSVAIKKHANKASVSQVVKAKKTAKMDKCATQKQVNASAVHKMQTAKMVSVISKPKSV